MNVLGEVQDSLRSMGFGALLLAMLFLASYPLSIGGFATPRVRSRCQAAAALCVLGFAVMAPSWVHAALIAAFGLVAVGGFIVLAWLLSRLLGVESPRQAGSDGAEEPGLVAAPAVSGHPIAPPRPARAT